MKVLFIINSLKNKSGSERVAVELANKLFENFNYDITIINRDSFFYDAAYVLNKNIKVIKISGNAFIFFCKVQKKILDNSYNIVIVHNMGKISILCSLLMGVDKLVSLEHISYVSRPMLVKIFIKYLYKKFDQIITLTKADKSRFENFHHNVKVIPNFSPFPSTYYTKKSNIFLAVGRLSEQKNFIHLLKAWKLIQNRIPEWSLYIYGEGEQEIMLKKYIKNNNLKNIHLKNVTNNISCAYKVAKVFVLTSKYEGLPMVLIEAQSFGVPIISYDCPNGPKDIVQNEYNGFLIKNQDIDQLAQKMVYIAKSPEIIERFKEHSLVNAENFKENKIIEIWKNEVIEK